MSDRSETNSTMHNDNASTTSLDDSFSDTDENFEEPEPFTTEELLDIADQEVADFKATLNQKLADYVAQEERKLVEMKKQHKQEMRDILLRIRVLVENLTARGLMREVNQLKRGPMTAQEMYDRLEEPKSG